MLAKCFLFVAISERHLLFVFVVVRYLGIGISVVLGRSLFKEMEVGGIVVLRRVFMATVRIRVVARVVLMPVVRVTVVISEVPSIDDM